MDILDSIAIGRLKLFVAAQTLSLYSLGCTIFDEVSLFGQHNNYVFDFIFQKGETFFDFAFFTFVIDETEEKTDFFRVFFLFFFEQVFVNFGPNLFFELFGEKFDGGFDVFYDFVIYSFFVHLFHQLVDLGHLGTFFIDFST